MARKTRPAAAVALYELQRRFGWRKATWLLDFMAGWAVAVRANGWEPINVEQYAAYWKMSRATGFRDQQRWRDMFPDEPTPNERVLAARRQYERLAEQTGGEPRKGDVAALFAGIASAA